MNAQAVFYGAEVDGCDEPADEFIKVPVLGVLDEYGSEIVMVGDRLTFSLVEALDLAHALQAAVSVVAKSVMYE